MTPQEGYQAWTLPHLSQRGGHLLTLVLGSLVRAKLSLRQLQRSLILTDLQVVEEYGVESRHKC